MSKIISIADREKMITNQLLYTTIELKKISKSLPILFENNFIKFQTPFIKLFGAVNEIENIFFESNFFESEIENTVNSFTNTPIKNDNGNIFVHLKNVKSLLDNHENSINKTLNETFTEDESNITIFSNELNAVLQKLEKQNDFQKYNDSIIKTKILSKNPIFVHGFDIINNGKLIDSFTKKYKTDKSKIKSIIINKSGEQIYIIFDKKCCAYDINTDQFNIIDLIINENYYQQLITIYGNSLIELYVTDLSSKIKSDKNLYGNKFEEILNSIKNGN